MHQSGYNVFDELDFLLSVAGRQLAQSISAEDFLSWIAQYGPDLAPQMNARVSPQSEADASFFRLLGIEIYNLTPLPANNYKPSPIPKPGRNDPCLCGSGRKYKQCCQHQPAPPPLGNYNMLRHMLDAYTQKSMAELVHSQVDTEALADTAIQWLQEGEDRRAFALLEPWFKGDAPLTKRHGPLFDPMMDAYLYLDKPRKRQQLLERACQAKDSTLRADAWQRKATILMDKGDKSGAWQAFTQAQRANPDDPSLAVLEITLLCANNEIEQARQRAQFWLARLERKGTTHPELLDLLEHCTVAPDEALRGAALEDQAPLAEDAETFSEKVIELAEAILNAPPAEALYSLDDHGDVLVLHTPAELMGAEQQWHSVTEQWYDAHPWDNIDQWLSMLKVPLSWHSITIMADLLNLILDENLEPLRHLFHEPLVHHCEALIEKNLAPQQAGQELPWGFLENRALLTLIQLVARYYTELGDLALFSQYAEQLLALNPNDNQGVRWDLSAAYLLLDEPEKVLQLCQQFSDDESACHTPLNKILALYMLGRLDQAKQALNSAKQQHQGALNMLLAANPKPPERSPFGIELGGKEEAWLYRAATHNVWQTSGALKWLKAALKPNKKP